jgi:hypothetical protein
MWHTGKSARDMEEINDPIPNHVCLLLEIFDCEVWNGEENTHKFLGVEAHLGQKALRS